MLRPVFVLLSLALIQGLKPVHSVKPLSDCLYVPYRARVRIEKGKQLDMAHLLALISRVYNIHFARGLTIEWKGAMDERVMMR